jgi:hypothetical protein
MDDVVEQHVYDNAGAFLDALHPRLGVLPRDPGRWVFRGLRDAEFLLLPAAHRPEAWRAYRTGGFDPGATDEIGRRAAELDLVRWFWRSMDRSALPMVDDPITRAALFEMDNEFYGELIPIFARAQHHGIPTRLLDWSERCAVAAYFACEDPLDKITATHLAVWALDRNYIRALKDGGPKALSINVTTAPRASNPNLHAQSGGFTYCRNLGALEPLDQVVRVLAGADPAQTSEPVMHRFVLPRSQAKPLLTFLHEEGVSGSSMFPDVAGVMAHMRECVWCGRPAEVTNGW